MTIPKFKTRSVYPHFPQPKLLVHLYTLHIVDLIARDFGWWETLIVACSSLAHLQVTGEIDIVFQAVSVVAQCSHKLETLQLVSELADANYGYNESDSERDFTEDMLTILEKCDNLREVRVIAESVPLDVVCALSEYNISFLVASNRTEMYERWVQNEMVIDNVTMGWTGMSHECIEQCIRDYLPGPDYRGPQAFWMYSPPSNFDYVNYLSQLDGLWSLELNNCREMTSDVFTLLLQCSYLHCIKLEFNDIVHNFTNDEAWENCNAQDIELRAFTALTYRVVQRITLCCPLVQVVTVDMPRMPGELHGHVDV